MVRTVVRALVVLILCGSRLASAQSAKNPSPATGAQLLVYIGTYTGTKSKGIYLYRMDPVTGALASAGVAAETKSPSFLAIHPNHRFLYAVNEMDSFSGKPGGAVSAFSINATDGKLTLLDQQPSGGGGPCHLIVDRAGKNVLVANYGGGSVEVLPILENGGLGAPTAFIQHQGSSVNSSRQEGPHGHCVALDAVNRFALVADLGLDKILVYRFNARKGTLTPNDEPSAAVKPGAGPRHLAFHPKGRFLYVINEIDSTITGFAYDARHGRLKNLETTVSTLPNGPVAGNSTAELVVHPSGKFLYGSNRGHNSIVSFAIDAKSGRLTYIEDTSTQGKVPRSFGIDPTGTFLVAANQESDTVVVFRIDPYTGHLSPTGQQATAPSPVSVSFLPAGTE